MITCRSRKEWHRRRWSYYKQGPRPISALISPARHRRRPSCRRSIRLKSPLTSDEVAVMQPDISRLLIGG